MAFGVSDRSGIGSRIPHCTKRGDGDSSGVSGESCRENGASGTRDTAPKYR
ncbi:hypothetical protein KI387_035045, partial [Taxus chinensis]